MLAGQHKKAGFTLLEMVTVVFIIALLASAVLATFYKVRSNTRDTRRVASITQIQDALEAYYRDEGYYPVTADVAPGSPLQSGNLVYIQEVPHNPDPWTDGPCPNQDFSYQQIADGDSYSLSFCLGHQTSNLPAGSNIAMPNGIIPGE